MPERIAILRFENLGDPAADWVGRALAEVTVTAIGSSPGLSAVPAGKLHGFDGLLGERMATVPGISAERTQAMLAGANRIGYGRYQIRNGRLDAVFTVEDPARIKTVREIALSGPAADPIALAENLARQLGGSNRPYSTRDAGALRAFVAATENPAAAATGLETALRLDPGYAAAALAMVHTLAAAQDRAGAEAAIRAALAHGERLSPGDRARLEIDAATLRNDRAARRQAVAALAKAEPRDPAVWLAVGEEASSRHDAPEALKAFRQAAGLEPNGIAALNAMGYAAAQAGDLVTATEALRRYEKLRPQEANPLDSLGDVNYYLGHFQEAEGFYLQAYRKDPRFLSGATLFKAALARLMTGDVTGADQVMERFWQQRQEAKDAALEYRRAEWLWFSGRRREAAGRMAAFAQGAAAGPLREVAARACAQLAIWRLQAGDTATAAALAQRGLSLAGPRSAAPAVLARFLAQPRATAAEWKGRGERAFPLPAQAAFRNMAVVYALLLAREYAAALPLLQEMYASPALAGDIALPPLLGWAYWESGDPAKAAPFLAATPIPPPTGLGLTAGFYLPRLFYLRSVLAEKQGNHAAARQQSRIFLQLSAGEPLLWGEEAQAQALAK